MPDVHKTTLGPLISSIGDFHDYLSSEYTSDTGALSLDVLHIHAAFQSIARSVVFHTWTFRDIFNVQIGACDEFYPRSVVQEMVKETQRWIDAFVAESEAKARL